MSAIIERNEIHFYCLLATVLNCNNIFVAVIVFVVVVIFVVVVVGCCSYLGPLS